MLLEKIYKNRHSRWLIPLIGWSLVGVFMGMQTYALALRNGHPLPLTTAFEREFTYSALWCLLTPFVLGLSRRYPLDSRRWQYHAAMHFVCGVAISFIQKAGYHFFNALLEQPVFDAAKLADAFRGIYGYIDYGAMIYWIMILMHSSIHYYGKLKEAAVRSARLESQLVQAQLQSLKMQLQPHFLFNTLNAISVLVQKDPEMARQMLLRLSDLLRLTLQKMESDEISLRQELDFLNRYLEIEKMRFTDRLTIEVSAGEDVMDALVPTMILQPLVENAMRHGIAQQQGPALLRIEAQRSNGSVVLTVYDNGPGVTGQLVEGIGISNTRARIEQHYGADQQFSCENVQKGGFCASLSIPMHTNPQHPGTPGTP